MPRRLKVLIAGDSFSADWRVKYPAHEPGWPNMLAERHQCKNVAMAGSSIARTLWQLEAERLEDYDAVVVAHTSPYRIYVDRHPVHHSDPLHRNADLIHTDIKHHAETRPELRCIVDYYERYHDLHHARFVYNLIEEKICQLLDTHSSRVVHMTNLPREGLYRLPALLDCSDLQGPEHHGLMNHYNLATNRQVYERVLQRLEQ